MNDFDEMFKESTEGLLESFQKRKEQVTSYSKEKIDKFNKAREEKKMEEEREAIRQSIFNINEAFIGESESLINGIYKEDTNDETLAKEEKAQVQNSSPAPTTITKNEKEEASEAEEDDAQEELPVETMEEILEELHKLTGLDEIKSNIDTLVNLLRIQDERKAHELPIVEIGLHQALLGAPGTGKTTIARIIGRMYKAAGRLSKGHLVETDRQGLVGGFVGQTAIKTQEVLESAKGGVLFVDEAYSLVPKGDGSDFGQEAITTILKFMEDNRDDFVLIVAGYDDEMTRFLDSNPGLVSRFNDVITFPDYSADELFEIFENIASKSEYKFAQSVGGKIKEDFTWLTENKTKNFANGRTARKYFESIVENHANRLSKNKENTKRQLHTFVKSDLPTELKKLA